MDSQHSLAIVISADGRAAVAEFDRVTGACVKLHDVTESLGTATKVLGGETNNSAKEMRNAVVSGNAMYDALKKVAEGTYDLVRETINAADETGKLAERLGISTEFISGMGYAAAGAGSSAKAFNGAIGTLSDNVAKAGAGAHEAMLPFMAMGVSVRDAGGHLKSLEQLLPEVADRFHGYADGPAKAELATKLFGAAGKELIPLLNLGSAGLKEQREQAEALGLVFDSKTSKAAADFNDNLSNIANQAKGAAAVIAKDVLPILVAITGQFTSTGTKAKDAGDDLHIFQTAVEYVGLAIIGVRAEFGYLMVSLEAIGKFGAGAAHALQETYGDLTDAFNTGLKEGPLAAARKLWVNLQTQGEEGKAAAEAFADGSDSFSKGIDKTTAALTASYNAITKAANEARSATSELGKTKPPAPEMDVNYFADRAKKLAQFNAEQKAVVATSIQNEKAFINVLQQLAGQLEGPSARAAAKYEDAIAAINREESTYLDLGPPSLEKTKAIAKARADAAEVLRRTNEYLKEYPPGAEGVLKSMRDEIEQIGMTNEQRELSNRLREIERQALLDGHSVDSDYTRGLEAEAIALHNTAVAAQHYADATENGRRIVGDFASDFGESLITAARKGGSEFNHAIDDMVDRAIESILRLQFINPLLNSFFGLTNTSAALPVANLFSGAGSGGIFSAIGSLFGGGGAAAAGAGGGGISGTFAGLSQGVAAGGSTSFFGGLTSSLASIPVAGWIAAAVLANGLFSTSGWAMGGGSLKLPDGQVIHGGGTGFSLGESFHSGLSNVVVGAMDRFYRGLGLSNSAASILSGGGLLTRLFGHQAPRLTGSTLTGSFSDAGVSATELYNIKEKGGIFSSDRRYTRSGTPDAAAVSALNDFFKAISDTVKAAAHQLEVDEPHVLASAFRTVAEYDKKGKVTATKYFVDVLGRSWEEATAEAAQTRIMAESIVAVVGQSASDASAIAEQWRANADDLLSGARTMLQVQTDVVRGNGLLGADGGLADIVKLLQQLEHPGEELAATYERVVSETKLLEQATDLMGVTLDKSRTAFVEFAAGIADAAGGLDQATALWQSYFNTFFSAEERAQFALAQAQKNADKQLGDIGLTSDVTPEQFRQLFTEALPNLSAEATVEWLEAADAIAQVIKATTDLNGTLPELGTFMAAVRKELLGYFPSAQFRQGLRDVYDSMVAAIAQATKLGASETDLAQIRLLAARKAAAAIAELEHSATDLATKLYGTPLSRIEDQIASLEAAGGLNGVASGINQVAEAARSFVDEINLDSRLSPLSVREQTAEALRQLGITHDAATGRRALELGRQMYASGADYASFAAQVEALVRPTTSTPAGGGGPSGDLAELYAQRDRLQAQQDQAQRLDDARQLAQYLADLNYAQGTSYSDLAASRGFSLDQLAQDLGLTADGLTQYLQALHDQDPTTTITAGDNAIIEALYDLFGDPSAGDSGASKPGAPVRIAKDAAEPSGPSVPTPAPERPVDRELIVGVAGVGDRIGQLIDQARREADAQGSANTAIGNGLRDVQRAIEELSERLLTTIGRGM